jgi:protein-S-isoprenylcysteine O-methyltransferase Ste14
LGGWIRFKDGNMALREELVREGNWLFRWRSFLPLVLLVPLLFALRSMQWPLENPWLFACWKIVCGSVSLTGLALRMVTTGYAPPGTSGRSTRHQVARTLNTTGMYSVVRNPLYLGNFLIFLGIAMYCLVWWYVVIYVLAFWLYYERIIFAEEDFLRRKFGEQFEHWASRTPRFIPRFMQWTRPATPFSVRRVLRKEYTGLFGIVAGYFAMDVAEHLVVQRKLVVEPEWAVLGGAALVIYLTLIGLKKCTRLLHPTEILRPRD